jgi:Fungal Zn(2)-Cys(6) binuclear cluster domain
MDTIPSPDPFTSDDNESQQVSPDEQPQDQLGPISSQSGQPLKPSVPVQKRRRVTRACDECRRKKIKCDGADIGREYCQIG